MYNFTSRAAEAINQSNKIAQELGHSYIGTEHVLYGLAKEGQGVAHKILLNQNITADKIITEIESLIGRQQNKTIGMQGFTPRTKRVLENAFIEAKKLGNDYIGTEHLLISIIKEAESVAARILMDLNMEPAKMYNEIMNTVNQDDRNKNTEVKGDTYGLTPTLNQFAKDLTELALKR